MNIDTDTQWAFWDGVRAYELKNRDYLQGQIGNPDGDDKVGVRTQRNATQRNATQRNAQG